MTINQYYFYSYSLHTYLLFPYQIFLVYEQSIFDKIVSKYSFNFIDFKAIVINNDTVSLQNYQTSSLNFITYFVNQTIFNELSKVDIKNKDKSDMTLVELIFTPGIFNYIESFNIYLNIIILAVHI